MKTSLTVCIASWYRYDPHQDRWGPVPKLNTARFALSAAATHGALYAVGGFNGEQYMSTVEMLDPRVGRYYKTISRCFFLHIVLQKQPYLIGPFLAGRVCQAG